jgi:hypothetical protein
MRFEVKKISIALPTVFNLAKCALSFVKTLQIIGSLKVIPMDDPGSK